MDEAIHQWVLGATSPVRHSDEDCFAQTRRNRHSKVEYLSSSRASRPSVLKAEFALTTATRERSGESLNAIFAFEHGSVFGQFVG